MDQTTNFANSKKRMIRMSAKGVPFVMTAAGKKSYGPKAAFSKSRDGGLRKLVKSNSVPNKIAPAMLKGRKVRSNAGTSGMRKVRSNKGVARGPRALVASPRGTVYKGMGAATRRKGRKVLARNPFLALINANM
jgi:hypothetical protein